MIYTVYLSDENGRLSGAMGIMADTDEQAMREKLK